MTRKKMKRIVAMILVLAIVYTGIDCTTFRSEAATQKTKSITLNAKSKSLTVGKTYQLKVKQVKPSKASKSVTWKSSNKKIATVSKKGKVTAKKPGTVKITATSKSNKKVKAVCKIKVYAKVKKVSLNRTEANIKVGENLALKATVQPSTAMRNVTWKTSDKSIATVNSKGCVTGKKVGSVTITAISKSNKKKVAECKIIVSDNRATMIPTVVEEPTVTVKPTAIQEATATPTTMEGGTVTVTIEPTATEGVTDTPTPTLIPTITAEPTATVVPTSVQRPTPTPISTVMPKWDEGITREEWISALVKKVNVSITEENLIKDEDTNEPIYTYDDMEQCAEPLKIEAAYQNGILPEENLSSGEILFQPSEMVTREFAVATVMRALGFYDETKTLECADKNKVTNTVEVAMAIEYGLIDLKDNKFMPEELLTEEESKILFQFIEEILKARVIDENHEDVIEFTENVKDDYENVTQYSVLEVTEKDEIVLGIPLTQEIEPINVGDIISLPQNESYQEGLILKVHDTYYDYENNLLKVTGSNPENIFDVYQHIDIEGYAEAVLDEIELGEGVTMESAVSEDPENQSGDEWGVTENSINGSDEAYLSTDMKFEYEAVKVTFRMKKVGYDIDFNKEGINQLYYSMDGAIILSLEGPLKELKDKDVHIATIPIKIAPIGITLKVKITLVPTAKGTVALVYTVAGTQGVQYYNGELIPIKELSSTADVRCNAEFGLGIRADLGLYMLEEVDEIIKFFTKEEKESKPVFNIGVEAGVKAVGLLKKENDSNNICSDLYAYVYAELYAGKGSLLEQYFQEDFDKAKISLKCVIWDYNHSKWKKNIHVEVGSDGIKIVEKCTKKSCNYTAEVYGESDEKVGNVKVKIVKKGYAGEAMMKREVTTDSDGNIIVDKLSPGKYEITYQKVGYDTYVDEVDFTALEENSVSQKIVLTENGILYAGTYGDTEWCIDKKGHLLVTGTGDMYDGTPGWKQYAYMIKTAEIDVQGATSCKNLFSSCTNLEEIDFANFDMSNIADMSYMFYGCSSLKNISTEYFDTHNVTNMRNMFCNCEKLEIIDLSNFNTKNVTDMYAMFSHCKNLINIDLLNLDVSNVINMEYMFDSCEGLEKIDFSNFDICNVTSMSYMFSGCENLKQVDLSNCNVKQVQNMSRMFGNCKNLTTIKLINFDTSSVTDMSGMFYWCESLLNLDVSNFDTSNVTSMNCMFLGCSSLKSLNMANFNTSAVTSMFEMFEGCKDLETIDVSNFDTSNVTNMSAMFKGCENLKSVDVSNFDTSNVKYMNSMFTGCTDMECFELADFNTSNVTNMNSMFAGCTSIGYIDLSNFNTSNVKDMSSMFANCTNLIVVDLSGFDVTNVINMGNMFYKCPKLEKELSKIPFL